MLDVYSMLRCSLRHPMPHGVLAACCVVIMACLLSQPTVCVDYVQGRARPSLAKLYNWRYKDLGDLPAVQQEPVFKKANAGFAFDYQFIGMLLFWSAILKVMTILSQVLQAVSVVQTVPGPFHVVCLQLSMSFVSFDAAELVCSQDKLSDGVADPCTLKAYFLACHQEQQVML